jgi:hypothetical protein
MSRNLLFWQKLFIPFRVSPQHVMYSEMGQRQFSNIITEFEWHVFPHCRMKVANFLISHVIKYTETKSRSHTMSYFIGPRMGAFSRGKFRVGWGRGCEVDELPALLVSRGKNEWATTRGLYLYSNTRLSNLRRVKPTVILCIKVQHKAQRQFISPSLPSKFSVITGLKWTKLKFM